MFKKVSHVSLEDSFERYSEPRKLHTNNEKEQNTQPQWKQVAAKQAGMYNSLQDFKYLS